MDLEAWTSNRGCSEDGNSCGVEGVALRVSHVSLRCFETKGQSNALSRPHPVKNFNSFSFHVFLWSLWIMSEGQWAALASQMETARPQSSEPASQWRSRLWFMKNSLRISANACMDHMDHIDHINWEASRQVHDWFLLVWALLNLSHKLLRTCSPRNSTAEFVV